MLEPQAVTEAAATASPEAENGLVERLTAPVLDVLDRVGNLVLLTGQTLSWMIRPPYRIAQLFAALEFIGVESIFIVGLTGTFSGMVLALQTTNSLRQFGAEGIVGSV